MEDKAQKLPAAAQPAATPMAARTFEEWWAESHRFATDADRMDHLIHVLSCPAMAAREAAEDAWNAATLAAAAQPQRESEQPEQALREVLEPIIRGWMRVAKNNPEIFLSWMENGGMLHELLGVAALSPQTDSQEPRNG